MANKAQIIEFIGKCKKSASFFMQSCCKIKHPLIGIIPFKLFKYQLTSLRAFRENRFNIFRKCRQCFIAGTPVWTPNGPVPIESIKPNDIIYTLNEGTGKLEITKVSASYDNGIANLIEVQTKAGHKSICTPDHKFYTISGYKAAKELTPNDIVIQIAEPKSYKDDLDGSKPILPSQVKSVTQLNDVAKVYDLTTPPHHNYIVDGAVVHNCGASTLTGIYALWVAMFFGNKKILIVSKRDQDAKEFLKENVKLVYNNLPAWMHGIWPATIENEHELGFGNGSIIRSLTSSADTLRSNASFLNIIDEAAFMPDMEAMWAGGWSTLQHGGSVIVISTPNGVGNWYWDKWTDAEEGGLFNPILIHWWNMDWVIEAKDPISNKKVRIAPTDGIRKSKTKAEIERFGKFWSPWLEKEFQGLQARGESHLFRQEVLGEFIGSGGTILSASALHAIGKSVGSDDTPEVMTIAEPVTWTNQATGDQEELDFVGEDEREGLWIWAEPVAGSPAKYKNGRMVDRGEPGHTYVIGVDIATGENNDYSAIEVFDITTMEQVAEFMGRPQVAEFAKMVDWVGRWYNTALVNPERTGIGIPFIQDLQNIIYPSIWRAKKRKTPRPGAKARSSQVGYTYGPYGFPTTGPSKPTLNKALISYLGGHEGEGYTIYSPRLYKQLQIYIRHRNRQGIETKKTGAQEGRGNHDDLTIAAALAFVAAPDAIDLDPMGLVPTGSKQLGRVKTSTQETRPSPQEQQKKIMSTTDYNTIIPLTYNTMHKGNPSPEEQLGAFAQQLITTPSKVPIVKKPRIDMRPR